MRLLIPAAILLLVGVVLGGWSAQRRAEARAAAELQATRDALMVLTQRARYQGTLLATDAFGFRAPPLLDPAWFGGRLPSSALAGDRPTLDIAPPGDRVDQPPDPVLLRPTQAGLWYNPTLGVFRARVPLGLSDADTLAAYNRVNGTALTALPRDPAPARQPLAFAPGQPPAVQYAAIARRQAQAMEASLALADAAAAEQDPFAPAASATAAAAGDWADPAWTNVDPAWGGDGR